MVVLSKEPSKAELQAQVGQECKLGKDVIRVTTDQAHTKSGSYERGFKFHTTTYVVLMRKPNAVYPELSYDYGKTWSTSRIQAMKSAGRAKIMLNRETQKEFAYDAIQKINREYGM